MLQHLYWPKWIKSHQNMFMLLSHSFPLGSCQKITLRFLMWWVLHCCPWWSHKKVCCMNAWRNISSLSFGGVKGCMQASYHRIKVLIQLLEFSVSLFQLFYNIFSSVSHHVERLVNRDKCLWNICQFHYITWARPNSLARWYRHEGKR